MGCGAHLVHLPLTLFAPEILKYLEKNRIKFSEHSENFIFGSFFIAREIQKTDKTWHLFYLTYKNRKQKAGTEGSAY